MSIDHNFTSDTTKLAAQHAPEFKFSSAEITHASAKHAALIGSMQESAVALTETFGKSALGGAAAGLITGMPLVGLTVGAGIAVTNLFSGSKKDGPIRS